MPQKPITDDLEADWKLVRPNTSGGRGHARFLVGKLFGHLEVKAREGSDKNGASLWRCHCHLCGKTKVVSRPALMSGRVKSCGCLKASQASQQHPHQNGGNIRLVGSRAVRKPSRTLWKRLQEE